MLMDFSVWNNGIELLITADTYRMASIQWIDNMPGRSSRDHMIINEIEYLSEKYEGVDGEDKTSRDKAQISMKKAAQIVAILILISQGLSEHRAKTYVVQSKVLGDTILMPSQAPRLLDERRILRRRLGG